MITREAYGPHSPRGALGSNFGRYITMITPEVLELEVINRRWVVLSRVASVPLLLGTTRLFGVEATFSSCLLEYVKFLFGVLAIQRGSCVDLVQAVMWWRSKPLCTSD